MMKGCKKTCFYRQSKCWEGFGSTVKWDQDLLALGLSHAFWELSLSHQQYP